MRSTFRFSHHYASWRNGMRRDTVICRKFSASGSVMDKMDCPKNWMHP